MEKESVLHVMKNTFSHQGKKLSVPRHVSLLEIILFVCGRFALLSLSVKVEFRLGFSRQRVKGLIHVTVRTLVVTVVTRRAHQRTFFKENVILESTDALTSPPRVTRGKLDSIFLRITIPSNIFEGL